MLFAIFAELLAFDSQDMLSIMTIFALYDLMSSSIASAIISSKCEIS